MNTRCAQWLVLWLMLAPAAVAGESSDGEFLAGLRERGLYSLAETYCADRLRREDLSDDQRADLLIELSRCLAEWAVSSPPEAREPLWQRAAQVVEDFARTHPQNPRLPLVRFQQALGYLARGELARQEAELAAEPGSLLDDARTHLRAAVRGLDELAGEVEDRLRQQSLPGRREPGQLSADQLSALRRNVQYELSRALRNQAQCYEADSPDRANCLTQAVRLLVGLAKLAPADPLGWQSRIDLIVSYRLLADRVAALREVADLLELRPPPPVQLRARAEQIRLALVADQLEDAMSVLAQGRQIGGTTSPELDYAWLETYLAAGRAAAQTGSRADAEAWQAKALEMLRQIEQSYGAYWTRRAGMLLSRYVRGGPGGDIDILVRAAESSFRSGQFADALAAYDRAAGLAAEAGQLDRAFDLGYVAATIEHQRGRHEQALARYRQLATAMPNQPRAAEAHLLAIYHAAQLARRQQPGSLELYAALLEEHLRTWPMGPTADRVRRQWGQLRQYQGDWQGAIRAYQAISPDDADYLETARDLQRCYLAWLAELEAAGQPGEQLAGEAADWFESLVLGAQGRMPERLGPLQRFAILAAARLRLGHTASGYGRAQGLLSAALETAADAPPEWKSAAEMLLVVCLAGQGRNREAGELLTGLSRGSPGELLGMLEGLERVAAAAGPEIRGELAQLQLAAIGLMPAELTSLSQSERQTLERIRAGALADAGRTGEALDAYRALAAAHPRDGAIQEAYATLLLVPIEQAPNETARRQSIETALDKWRELEQNSPQRSHRWFLAKYWVAWLQLELGDGQQAARIITLLGLLQPDLGGPEMKPRFEELLRRCQE